MLLQELSGQCHIHFFQSLIDGQMFFCGYLEIIQSHGVLPHRDMEQWQIGIIVRLEQPWIAHRHYDSSVKPKIRLSRPSEVLFFDECRIVIRRFPNLGER